MANEAPPISLTVEMERHDGSAVVRCRGRLVAELSGFFHQKISPLIPGCKHIVLDFSELDYVDSMGLGTLVRLYVSSKSAGCRLELIHIGKHVRELLGLTHLLQVFVDIGEKGVKHR